MPVTMVKILDIHSDAKFHELYPNDEERAHREAAAAMEDCPFCHIQLSQFVVAEDCVVPQVHYIILHEYSNNTTERIVKVAHSTFLRAPPTMA